SDLSGLRFSTRLTGDEFFLADHVVQGVRVLPGVAQLEMARSAVAETIGVSCQINLSEIVWIRPIAVDAEGLTLHVALYPEENEDLSDQLAYKLNYEIYSDTANGESLSYSQGVVLVSTQVDANTSVTYDLAALRQQYQQTHLRAEECYTRFGQAGLQYGPSFQGLTELFVGEQQVLAQVTLPTSLQLQSDTQRYQLHPSLLDAALQASLGLQLGTSSTASISLMLPFALNALEDLAPCTHHMWAVVRYSVGSSANDNVQKIDIDLCDENGVVCIRFKEFSMRALALAGRANNEPIQSATLALDGAQLLAPVWDVVRPVAMLGLPDKTARVLVLDAQPAQYQQILKHYPNATILSLAQGAQIAQIEAVFREQLAIHAAIDHLIWVVDADASGSSHEQDRIENEDHEGNEGNGDDAEALIAAQQNGLLRGFRLVKALLALGFAERALSWTILTTQTQAVHPSDTILPAHAGVHGFIGSMTKELRRWQVRLLDLPQKAAWPWEDLFQLPYDAQGDALAWRSGQWFYQKLQAVRLASDTSSTPLYRQGGVYVVIGGAGGIGQAWSEHMIRNFQANIVWIGRRAADEAILEAQTRLGALGGTPLYIAADAADRTAMEHARAQILTRFPHIHGVVHAAIVLLDKSLAQMDEERLQAGLSAKIDVSVRMQQVFGGQALDFMLFCSSLLSFIKAAGQSNYAAGCTFKDAYSLQLAKRLPYPVRVMNWGYWGSVGVVASPVYRERMAQMGIGSIEPQEGMRAIESLMSADLPQMGFIKLIAQTSEQTTANKTGIHALIGDNYVAVHHARFASLSNDLAQQAIASVFPVDAATLAQQKQEIDQASLKILWSELYALGLFAPVGAVSNLSDAAAKIGLRSGYERWLAHSVQCIVQAGLLTPLANDAWCAHAAAISPTLAWVEWDERKAVWNSDPNLRAQVLLVETMLRSLPVILRGQTAATAIMFPNSSMDLVEGIYRGNAVADYFNDVLCDKLLAFIALRLQQDPSARIRLLEIGAGTGGTSARVLARLAPYAAHIEQYCYTDLSRAFLLHAENKYGPDYPYLAYRLFDVASPLAGQQIEAASYDVVIATNVLHATKDIRESLRNAKAALRCNGLLLLNELSSFEWWAHLTFGLLDGWWLYEDESLRIPACPSLSSENWQDVLLEEGYRQVFFPAESAHKLGQQVIVAESDGVVSQRAAAVAKTATKTATKTVITPAIKTVAAKVITSPAMSVSSAASINRVVVQQTNASITASLRDKCLLQFKKLVGQTLKMSVDQIEAGTNLDQYGIDSILVLELSNALRVVFKDIGISKPVLTTLFFEHQNIDALVDHFIQTEVAAMMRWVGLDTVNTTTPLAKESVNASVPQFKPSLSTMSLLPTRRGRASWGRASAGVPLSTTPLAQLAQLAQLDIAIIGLSGRYPQAENVTEFWTNLAAGRNCISEVPAARWDHSQVFDEQKNSSGKAYTKWAGFIKDIDCFDPLFFNISPREAELMSPQERLFLQEAYASIEDAGYTPSNLSQSRKVGMFVGVMNEHYNDSSRYWSIANRVSYLFNFQGPSMAVDTACSSSLTAVHLALESLRSGSCEIALAGGVNLIVSPNQLIELSSLTMLSQGDKCKSFAADGDGFVDGEAVGAMVLKTLQQAITDGDHIYGVIKGSAVNSGGKTNGYMVPNPNSQAQLVQDALQRSGVDARSISY
ncbi:MAG: SDR family NAD(P)-dependent oxidoreductase, partial [Undibacterium sp.]|nr:SDR family NAD(P)-dependent oxidoreductase [Undibacterium sp.]